MGRIETGSKFINGDDIILQRHANLLPVLEAALWFHCRRIGRYGGNRPKQMLHEVNPVHTQLHDDPAGNVFRIIQPGRPASSRGRIAHSDRMDFTECLLVDLFPQPAHFGKISVHETDREPG